MIRKRHALRRIARPAVSFVLMNTAFSRFTSSVSLPRIVARTGAVRVSDDVSNTACVLGGRPSQHASVFHSPELFQ